MDDHFVAHIEAFGFEIGERLGVLPVAEDGLFIRTPLCPLVPVVAEGIIYGTVAAVGCDSVFHGI
jgi:hypothetical protein